MLSLSSVISNAYDYKIRFGENPLFFPISSMNWNSPHSTWYPITSKWQQPRDVSSTNTNPHRGMDNTAPYGTITLAVWNGWVIHDGAYTTIFQIDANNNGIKDDLEYYCYYQHLSTKSPEGYYTKGTQIAKSGDEGGKYPDHLHFGGTSGPGSGGRTDTLWYENEMRYRWTTNWNNGKDTDVYSRIGWGENNTICFYAYFKSSTGVKIPEVRLFHRKAGTSHWTDGGIITGDSNHRYQYSFTGKYPGGTNIHIMFRMTRNDLPSGFYKYCFIPAKFAQPDPNPNSTTNAYGYISATIY